MSEFSTLLLGFVTERGGRKRDIAEKCGYKAAAFSHLLHGHRPPRSREAVRTIASALGLTLEETNQLVTAAGFAPFAPLEQALGLEPARLIERALAIYAERGNFPGQEALAELMELDTLTLVAAWRGYLGMRDNLYSREWPKVAEEVGQRFDEWYWPLRRVAARFFAHLSLLAAATEHHIGARHKAIEAATAALDAARMAQEPMVHSRCHVRLADIYKSWGRYKQAALHYDEAETVLNNWVEMTPKQEAWVAHWTPRILRKRATLWLAQGQPARALPLLRESIGAFARIRDQSSRYERARANYALGWALGHLGDWEGSLRADEAGMRLTEDLAKARGRDDPRQLLEGYLGLATDHWRLQNYDRMSHYLDLAQSWIEGVVGESWGGQTYHEVGRYLLLRGRLAQVTGNPKGMDEAREAFQGGIAFHSALGRDDPARLASLYNAAGLLELDARKPAAALSHFQMALSWADSSDPPNLYYRADVLVNQCAVYLDLEEMITRRAAVLAEALEACRVGPFWLQQARLEAIWVDHCARTGDHDELVAHAAQSIACARQINSTVAAAMQTKIERAVHALRLPEEARTELLTRIVQRTDDVIVSLVQTSADNKAD